MKSSLIAILGLICIARAATLREISCQAATATASFNLNPLKLPVGQFYRVHDERTVSGARVNNTLFFNFCADIEPPQEMPEKCNITGPVDKESKGAAASFFQNFTNSQCIHSAGEMDVSKPSNSMEMKLLDPANPAAGVMLNLKGGEIYGNFRYETHINVTCTGEDIQETVPKKGVVFVNGHRIEIVIKSPYGCPTECITGKSLCGSHGICGFDLNIRKSHCYCNEGYTGTYCDKKNVFSWFNMTVLFVVLVVLLAVLILGFAIFVMYNKLRRIDARMNIDALNSLEKQFNQLGQLA